MSLEKKNIRTTTTTPILEAVPGEVHGGSAAICLMKKCISGYEFLLFCDLVFSDKVFNVIYLVLFQFFYDTVALIANLALSMIDACIILWISFYKLQNSASLFTAYYFCLKRNKRRFACFTWGFSSF